MLRISRYLPVHCAKGAEFASFSVCFLEFSGWTNCYGAGSSNLAQFAVVVGELCEIWLIRSNFPWFSVDGQRSET